MTVRTISVFISVVGLAALVFGLVIVAGTAAPPPHDDPWAHVPLRARPVDHAPFFREALPDGPAVTRRCLACHPTAAREVMQTSHWTWSGTRAVDPRSGAVLEVGKANLQNNFCVSVAGNWPRCTSCHVGYGWKDATFLENAREDQVDCLVCHDTSQRYEKDPKGAGHPQAGVDLVAVAKEVGRPGRTNCGVCHFKGGGGDGVKHGDLDETMYFPPERVDVHMGRHDLACVDCHQGEHHRIRGRLLPPEAEPATRVDCTDCHAAAPHGQERIDAHVQTVACQTCHIPTFAVETGTKMWWDWSKAGRDGDPHEVAAAVLEEVRGDAAERAVVPAPVLALLDRVGTDPDVWVHYDKKKGFFLIARDQVPRYRWYDRTTSRYLPGQPVVADGIQGINAPGGSARDPGARIWPFKVHYGRQPYDLELGHLLYPHVFGPGGFWSDYDWPQALRQGAEAAGVPFSGRFGWKTTEMFWPQNHMVRRKQDALRCADCHGPDGRMDWAALGYPGDPAVQGDRRQMDVVREARAPGGAEGGAR